MKTTKKNVFEQVRWFIRKSSLANIAAFTLVVGGLLYTAYKGDLEGVKMFASAGIGYLFKTIKE